jgi:hypothetical protein
LPCALLPCAGRDISGTERLVWDCVERQGRFDGWFQATRGLLQQWK